MRNYFSKLALTATLALAITLTLLSCSGSEDNPGGSSSGSNNVWNGEPIKKAKISGVSQKGPFIRGSEATLYELNSDLSQTGKNFQDIIADDKGSFEIKGIELVSPYALLKADGFYRNEVTGQISNSKITLYAIADVTEKSSVNVNILTHLEYRRVMKLAEGGMSIIDAKKQAQREILSVFSISGDFADSEDMSIFGTGEGDGALLAISILLQRDLNEGNFTAMLSDFNLGFAANGTWDNEEAKSAMADWAYGVDLEGIRNKIIGWGLSSSVPDFEKYFYYYWTANYGLGVCNSELQWETKKNANEKSENKDIDYACYNGFWEEANNVNTRCSKKSCFTDVRDGEIYSFVKIGEQTWIANNLNYNPSDITCYDNLESNCTKYGRCYRWTTAMALDRSCVTGCADQIQPKHKGICPSGWHLPSKEEFEALVTYVENDQGCTGCAAEHLMAKSEVGGTGLDSYGFSALRVLCYGGVIAGSTVLAGSWWSSSEYRYYDTYSGAYNLYIVDYYTGNISTTNKDGGSYVRCLKD